MKNVLITGATGFAGSFLTEYLVNQGKYRVSGIYLAENSLENVSTVRDKINLYKVDLLNSSEAEKLVSQTKPDLIFHLAAFASAGESFREPAKYLTNNIAGQVNILEGVKKTGIKPRILIVSSAEVYGNVVNSDLPIDEETALKPVNPYAVSKVTQDFLGIQYFYAHKIPIVVVRPFNHIGPRQSPAFAIASFAQKIARLEKNRESRLKVGNLSAKRDLSDVRDIVRGYVLLLEDGEAGEIYNIGSGKSYKVEDIVAKLIKLSKKKIKIEKDKNLLRPVDAPELVCDYSKIKNKTNWTPEIDINQSLEDTLDYWRALT